VFIDHGAFVMCTVVYIGVVMYENSTVIVLVGEMLHDSGYSKRSMTIGYIIQIWCLLHHMKKKHYFIMYKVPMCNRYSIASTLYNVRWYMWDFPLCGPLPNKIHI